MTVKIRPINFEEIEDFEYMTKCYLDDKIRHLFTVDFNNGPTVPLNPYELRAAKEKSSSNHTFMIEVDGKVVGDASVDTAFDMLLGNKEQTGWLGICIGDASCRGKGVGKIVMKKLENVCKEMGLKRLELGVFAYNEIAIKFYKSLGYKHFETVKKFTYYDGDWHDDYRMEKYI